MSGRYNSAITYIDGIKFDSKSEAMRYSHLLTKVEDGSIKDLELQRVYEIRINDKLICKYISDFTYYDVEKQKTIIEDVKNEHLAKSDYFNLKKKLLKAIYGYEIKIVFPKDVLRC